MIERERLPNRHVVLLGIGHTNAHVVRMWRMNPIPDTLLTCVSDNSIATYSGMLPAALAGQIKHDQMEIDLVRLCAAAGARLLTDKVIGLELTTQQIDFDSRPPVPFDVLSIGIGSIPTTSGVAISGDSLVTIKPMQSFLARLSHAVTRSRDLENHRVGSRFRRKDFDLIEASARENDSRPLNITIVGSGVAGLEIAFCLPPFLREMRVTQFNLRMVTSSSEVLPEVAASTRWRILSELARRQVEVICSRAVRRVGESEVELVDGTTIPADIVVWATGATPPRLLSQFGLPLDDNGFIATDHSLRSISGKPIFAVGDSGTIVGQRLPKAGVYAVRQGPILWKNIRRLLSGEPLQEYRPQRSFLKLLNLGDGRAVGQWRGLSFSGRWVMRWKDYIDTKFMRMFQPPVMLNDSKPMQCRGCGSKLGAVALQSALDSAFQPNSDGRVGKIAIEDAVEVGHESGHPLVASTDFFSAPFDDAYLNGRIAALHSASDILVSGADVKNALANVVLPEGERESQRQLLSDFLAGARHEFAALGASILGGHTIVGPRMEVGFTVIGKSLSDRLVRKSNLRPGDQLYLTKPLGIGVLLAAHARGRCPARDFEGLIEAMLFRQHIFARMANRACVDAGTDITGFGLAGHLLEMLDASQVAATIQLNCIPLLNGSVERVEEGVESSLYSDNFVADSRIDASPKVRSNPAYALLFDPQTCGGFLYGCTQEEGVRFLELATHASLPPPHLVGHVHEIERGARILSVSLS